MSVHATVVQAQLYVRPKGGFDRAWELQINEGALQHVGIQPTIIPCRYMGQNHLLLIFFGPPGMLKKVETFAKIMKEKDFIHANLMVWTQVHLLDEKGGKNDG